MSTVIEYTDSVEGIATGMLYGFFEGWKTPRTAEEHLKILRSSDRVVLAVDRVENRVVGFITALSDDIQSAFIPLLEVLPDYRGQGIGTELMTRMLKELAEIPAVDLMCYPGLQAFYSRFGMIPTAGMSIRRY